VKDDSTRVFRLPLELGSTSHEGATRAGAVDLTAVAIAPYARARPRAVATRFALASLHSAREGRLARKPPDSSAANLHPVLP
jgi:hypothetical protein